VRIDLHTHSTASDGTDTPAELVANAAAAGLDAVTARSYQHPALDGRTVVRLVGAAVGPAEDLTMEFLGFAPAGEPVEVGHARRQALGFPAWALVHDPANIILDEPTNGLDVLATRALRESLRWLRTPEGGSKCIVFSTHIMQEVERLCDSVVVVAHGRTVAAGTVPELLAQTGEEDFEEAFVKLAFSDEELADESRAEQGAAA